MVGRSTSKPTKGWALDDQEALESIGLRERIRDSGKLWIISFVALVGLSAIIIIFASSSSKRQIAPTLHEKPVGLYVDEDHKAFTAKFVKMANARGIKIRAGFMSDRDFRFVVPCDAAYDEVVFLSRAAALGVSRRFGVRPTILTYTEDITSPSPKLTAKTRWSDEKSDFIITSERS
jgi:hypothetical protein